MEYDEMLTELRITDDEKKVVEHLFKGTTGPDLRSFEQLPLAIRHTDRIWFDPESGTGISPTALIHFLRNEKPINGFESYEMHECRYHLEFLPRPLFDIAMKVYNAHRKPEPVEWEEEGF
jgi:hypothetical protein